MRKAGNSRRVRNNTAMAGTRAFADLSLNQLERIIARRRVEVQNLERRRAKLQRKVDAIDDRIRALGGDGASRSGPGSRARNPQSLVATLEHVMSKGEPMSVTEIVDGVGRTGYRSNSDNFRGIVNQTLIKERKRFGNTGRGMYQLKGKAGAKAD
jgi:hypothetical protein